MIKTQNKKINMTSCSQKKKKKTNDIENINFNIKRNCPIAIKHQAFISWSTFKLSIAIQVVLNKNGVHYH